MSRLYVTKITKNGAYLGSYEYPELKVLLPNNQVPKGTERGDIFQVFLYKDSEDRLIATTTEPAVQLGQMARLKVTDVTGIGAFLDWGLAKDLFLPFKEQTHRVKKGEEVLAALYIDKSNESISVPEETNERLDDVYQMAVTLASTMMNIRTDGWEAIVNDLMNSEPWCKYPAIKEKLLKEKM